MIQNKLSKDPRTSKRRFNCLNHWIRRKNQNSFDFKRDKHKGRKDRSRNEIFENFLFDNYPI